jgi:hypothetical protein
MSSCSLKRKNFEANRAAGTVEIRGKEKRQKLLARVDAVSARYRPDVVILQDMSEHATHRPHRIRRLNKVIAERAESHGVPLRFFSRNDVGDASLIYRWSAKAPSLRQPRSTSQHWGASCLRLANWKSEGARMGIFDAAALALTFFSTVDQKG